MQFSPKDAVVARSLSVKLNSRGNAMIYVCVCVCVTTIFEILSLTWIGFILDRKKKRFQTGLLSILLSSRGGSALLFPFFLFHFHSSFLHDRPNLPIPSNFKKIFSFV